MASITTVQQISIPLLEDYNNPLNGLINAAIINGDDVGKSILEYGLTNLKHTASAFYNYGKHNYIDGLPSGKVAAWVLTISTIQPKIEAVLGYTITINSAYITSANPLNYTLSKLSNEYDYDTTTQILHAHPYPNATTVTFEKIDIIKGSYDTEADILVKDQVACYVLVDAVSTLLFQEDYYTDYSNNGSPLGLGLTVEYVQNTYGKVFYYTQGQGIPELDNLVLETIIPNVYPIITIRTNSINILDGIDTARIKSTENALKILGISLDSVSTELKNNENIDIIEEAHITLATDVLDSSPEVIEYHMEYFKDVLLKYPTGKADYDLWYNSSSRIPVYTETVFQNDYNHSYKLNYVEHNIVDKIIGNIDTTSIETVIVPMHNGVDISLLKYYKQITTTQCDEVIVNGLFTHYRITGLKEVYTYLADATLGTDAERDLVLPLKHSIIMPLSTIVANAVVASAIRLNVFAVIVQKLKWYQTAFFKAALIMALVIYTIYTQDYTKLLALSTSEAIAYVLVTLAKSYVTSYIITQAALIVANLIGGDVALIITAVLAVYLLINGKFTIGLSSLGEVNSTVIMNSLLTASNTAITKEFNKDIAALDKKEQDAIDKLTILEDALPEDNTYLSDNYIHPNTPIFLPEETPEAFFLRTTEVDYTINLGTYVIDNFYESNIKLDLVTDY